jgi:Domain of unknown function (DUF1772)
MPGLKRISVPLDRISVWSFQFDVASKIMLPLGLISGISFGVASYYAPSSRLQTSMMVSSAFAFGIAPFTLLVVFPYVTQLKKIEKANDTYKATAEGDGLLDKWAKANLVRWLIMSVALLNGMKELSEWYTL